MSKKSDLPSAQPAAFNDFFKSNGLDHRTFNDEPSLTRQEFAEECDINSLMARYDTHVIGGPGGLQPLVPIYADFTAMPSSLQEFYAFMDDAEGHFMRLPAVVRKSFDNDPVRFVEFAQDEKNLDQMRKWGLAAPAPVEPAPIKVEVIAPAADPAPAPKAP